MSTGKKTRRITVSAMIAALSTVILYFGSFIEVLDLTMAVISSLMTAVMVIEYGKGAPWCVFGVTSLLSLLLLPQKFPALIYLLFFGYYPIIKAYIERIRKRVICWAIKIGIFAVATALLLFLSKLFLLDIDMPATTVMSALFVVLCALMLILYDLALTRMITYYIVRLRHRFKKIF